MKEAIDNILSVNGPLKARKIAKELGLPRKDVNAFLYSMPETYRQDAEFRWRLSHGKEVAITLPVGWVTGDLFEVAFQPVENAFREAIGEVQIIFPLDCRPLIDCIARLLALANQLAHFETGVALDFDSAEDTRTYLDRAGFFDLLDRRVTVLPSWPSESAAKRHQGQSDTLVEFGGVKPEGGNDDLIEQLTQKFVQQSNPDYRVAALTVFGELIENVREHSQTPLVGFAGLQKYRGRRSHIQTVVSDSGVGIAKTLRPALKEHYPDLYKRFGTRSIASDLGLVKQAMSEGRISRSGGAHGLGFHSSRQQAMRFDARFSVRQERFCLHFYYRDGELTDVREQLELSNLRGTHICFDFYVD